MLDDLSEIEKYFLDKVEYEMVEGWWKGNRESEMYDKSLYLHTRIMELIRKVKESREDSPPEPTRDEEKQRIREQMMNRFPPV